MTPKPDRSPKARAVDFPGLHVVGRSRRYTAATRAGIPDLWGAVMDELGEHMYGEETFGICHAADGEEFGYLVGFADKGQNLPDGLDHVKLPAGRYAVFDHEGHISAISETWAGIFDKGLDAAGLKPGRGPEFERYSAAFRPDRPGGVSIWIPVKS